MEKINSENEKNYMEYENNTENIRKIIQTARERIGLYPVNIYHIMKKHWY